MEETERDYTLLLVEISDRKCIRRTMRKEKRFVLNTRKGYRKNICIVAKSRPLL